MLHTDVDDVSKGTATSVRRARCTHTPNLGGMWINFGRPLTERICYVATGRRFGVNLVARDRTRCTRSTDISRSKYRHAMHTVPGIVFTFTNVRELR